MSESSLVESARAADEQKKTDAMARYRERLARNESPEKGDAKGLLADLETLGKPTADLAADLRIVQRAADLAVKAAGDSEEAEAQVEAASNAYREFIAETERIIAARKAEENVLWAAFQAAQRAFTSAREAGVGLEALKRKHYELFGIDPPAPEPAPPQHFQIVAPVEEARPRPLPTAHPRMGSDGQMCYGPGESTNVQTFGLPEPKGKTS